MRFDGIRAIQNGIRIVQNNIRIYLARAVVLLFVLLFMFGPPSWAIYRILTFEGSWITTRTITRTGLAQPIWNVIGGVFIWFIIVFLVIYMALWGPRA